MTRPVLRKPGISPGILIDAVESTAPFLFTGPDSISEATGAGFLRILRKAKRSLPDEHDLWDYFDLCLSAHFATVGTFVPTDVDLAIRQKLWKGVQAEAAFDPLWNRILEMAVWDESGVSARVVRTPSGLKLSGHQGEWFSVAMGAYGCARRSNPHRIGEIREQIEAVWKLQETALSELKQAFMIDPGRETMKAYLSGVAAVAHNLGDLDRMFDAWEIDDTDILKRRVYRSGHEDSRAPKTVLIEAGRVYQALIASENHRNFALRAPKGLRRSAGFLLPFGLFLDDWGRNLVLEGNRSGLLDEGDFREIIEALILGWRKLNPLSIYSSQGYSRALVGMATGFASPDQPEAGRRMMESMLPPAVRKEWSEGGLRTLTGIRQGEFEKKFVTRLRMLLSPG
jgi:hypothetical protein